MGGRDPAAGDRDVAQGSGRWTEVDSPHCSSGVVSQHQARILVTRVLVVRDQGTREREGMLDRLVLSAAAPARHVPQPRGHPPADEQATLPEVLLAVGPEQGPGEHEAAWREIEGDALEERVRAARQRSDSAARERPHPARPCRADAVARRRLEAAAPRRRAAVLLPRDPRSRQQRSLGELICRCDGLKDPRGCDRGGDQHDTEGQKRGTPHAQENPRPSPVLRCIKLPRAHVRPDHRRQGSRPAHQSSRWRGGGRLRAGSPASPPSSSATIRPPPYTCA